MNLAKLSARRIKRLKYWQQQFSNNSCSSVLEKLNTYNLLISKLVKASSASDITDSEQRLEETERELAALFEARRLMTSSSGIAAVKDTY